MSETAALEVYQPEHEAAPSNYWQPILDRVNDYDPAAPEAAHIRAHQAITVEAFRRAVPALAKGELEGGLAILLPTGSGKTVVFTELTRLICQPDAVGNKLRALHIVPNNQIMNQSLDDPLKDGVGAIRRFAPELSVGEYSGRRKQLDQDVTIMNYQSLSWAIRRGDIDRLNPDMIVCDEMHHIIDGQWARNIKKISAGRLLVGGTATPAYSDSRNITRLFPNVLANKTMREGIEEGVLSEMRGFMYRGTSVIDLMRQSGVDYDPEAVFKALANSEDNYLAAKIVSQEVANGRRGVVSCVPGYDRAHAKIMAKILNDTTVETPDGDRQLRAVFVDGEVDDNRLRQIFSEYKQGELDVITYVNLLLEGWDSPESDFSVLLRPTKSRVLAEQRIGRTIRPRIGKVAHIHELMYGFSGVDSPSQVTHLDVMREGIVFQGRRFGKKKRGKDEHRDIGMRPEPSNGIFFSAHNYRFDQEVSQRLAELDAIPLDEIRIVCGQDAIPIEWPTSQMLANRFGVDFNEVEAALASVPGRSEVFGDIVKMHYPPRAAKVLAQHLGLEEMTTERITVGDLVNRYSDYYSSRFARVSRDAVIKTLARRGFSARRDVTDDGMPIETYPPEVLDIDPMDFVEFASRSVRGSQRAAERARQAKEAHARSQRMAVETRHTARIIMGRIAAVPASEISRSPEDLSEQAISINHWLDSILINPSFGESMFEQRRIMASQKRLLELLNAPLTLEQATATRLKKQINEAKLQPTKQMENVIQARGLTFVQLLAAALQARDGVRKLQLQ